MSAYLSVSEFKNRTTMPGGYVDDIETVQAGWTLAQLESWSRWIDIRLGKRYRVPFTAPTEIIKSWLARIVTLKAWIRRGVDPSDLQFQEVKKDHDEAILEIKEAADGNLGLFDLPLSDAQSGSGIVLGGPRAYSESSPYVGYDVQRDVAVVEDRNRRGSE